MTKKLTQKNSRLKEPQVTMRNIEALLDVKLDSKLSKLTSDVEAIKSTMVTKTELAEALSNQNQELKSYIHEGIETIMSGMDSLAENFAEKSRVERLEKFVGIK